MKHWMALPFVLFLLLGCATAQNNIALSFDDPSTQPSPTMTWQQRNAQILQTLSRHQLTAALFVCGMRVNSPAGHTLLETWDAAGHLIANHSFSHPFFSGSKVSAMDFERELVRTDSMLRDFAHYRAWFRFPFLKEGKTMARRDSLRAILVAHGYRHGHVSIDASDWYVDQMLCDSLAKNPRLDAAPYGRFYVAHILDRAQYYDSLATAMAGRKVPLVLLLHHNLINALFLEDVIVALQAHGYGFVSPDVAYADPIYADLPTALPAGESFFWAHAKATGKFDALLRYPAEDGEYERDGLLRELGK